MFVKVFCARVSLPLPMALFFSLCCSTANFPTMSIFRADTPRVGEGLMASSLLYNFPERESLKVSKNGLNGEYALLHGLPISQAGKTPAVKQWRGKLPPSGRWSWPL